MLDKQTYRQYANAIRFLAIDAVEKAKSGHPGMPMGMADVATVLFAEFMNFSPKNPKWENRDRLILSAGHGSMLLYALFYLTGYEDISIEDIKNFRQLHSKTAGHPEYGYLAGIETTTGPLGQGLANGVGMAIAERKMNQEFGDNEINHKIYVIAGDGCLMEGISHEAISLAGHLALKNLVVLFDDNKISIDGPTDLTVSDDQIARFKASGWESFAINGHDYDEIRAGLFRASKSDKPTMIACRTNIAYGAPTKEGKSSSHGSPLGTDEVKGTREKLKWDHEPFVIIPDVLNYWRNLGKKGDDRYLKWKDSVKDHSAIVRYLSKDTHLSDELIRATAELASGNVREATRKSSGRVIDLIAKKSKKFIAGSADLTGSNNTKSGDMIPLTRNSYHGNYIYYGVREHAMGAIMNGIALYGGFIPFGGTFLVFSDYMRPTIRLAALMKQQVVYVMTHDSIGLGEDGPTHQPVEHLASLRAIPNLIVIRPADVIETYEAWAVSLSRNNGPTLLSLTRQDLPQLRCNAEENKVALGAYILKDAKAKFVVSLFASGSEVAIAMEAAEKLEKKNVGTRVISVPSIELFFNQTSSEYQMSLLCNNSIKCAIEAASPLGWERLIGPHGIFVGMNSFGESAPYEDLYKHFGITSDRIVQDVVTVLENRKEVVGEK